MKIRVLLLFWLVSFINVSGQGDAFSYKNYGNVANYFGSADEMKSFFDFRNGEIIAEVGAGDGKNIGGFGLISDSCTFYMQDIDANVMNRKNWDAIKKKTTKAGLSSKHQFNLVMGDERSTHLPAGIFDKIIMVSAFHEFSYMDEMIADIKTRLRSGGRVFILETKCIAPEHSYYKPEEAIEIMNKHGFHMMQRVQTQRNGSEGLYILSFYID